MKILATPLLLAASAFVSAAAAAQTPDSDDAFDDPFADFDDDWEEEESGLVWTGFVEGGYSRRLDRDLRFETRQALGDLRARLETDWSSDSLRIVFKGDALYDDYESEFETEIRELSLQGSPGNAVDLKVGRQVLTWGTGDLVFLNDLFPKSWVSFFSGRDDEYLKAPSDAIRLTWYSEKINVDAVWTPRFEPDDYLTGARFSFFSPLAGSIVAPRPPLAAMEPASDFENGEVSLRLFRTVGSTEYAAYLHRGFFRRPLGLSEELSPIFPALSVYGGSLRRPLARGLFNAEFAWHQSRDDSSGSNPLIPNDQLRLLLGYEFEAKPRFNVGLQYYLEWTQDHGALIENSPAAGFEPDEKRHVLTARLTYRTSQDKLTLSLFSFYSPSDDDYYLRPGVSFRQSDRWSFSAGGNLFGGKRDHTFFGQLEDNSNAWVRFRFSF